MELAYDIVERPEKYAEIPALDWPELRSEFCKAQLEDIRPSLMAAADSQETFDIVLARQGLTDVWERYVDEKAEIAALVFCEEHGLNNKTS
ncbi:hypothetical protein RWE15_13145 [Virgibacillus halophilus]|uniref:Uncharacterized protein n=2 Tax=Tigheibacillus halophilus TaxID=361280 RepID=A0ABU5C780_9BACI|nr:hypothetical protein [Virgibacillus halophilus]